MKCLLLSLVVLVSAAHAEELKSSDQDPEVVRCAIDATNELDRAVGKGEAYEVGESQNHLGRCMYGDHRDQLIGSPRWKAIRDRNAQLLKKLGEAGGAKALAALGDATRTSEAKPEALEEMRTAAQYCNDAAGADIKYMAEQYAKYEKQLARVKKRDERAVRFAGLVDGRYVDYPLEIGLCEFAITKRNSENVDFPPKERAAAKQSYVGCGVISTSIKRVKIKGAGWGPWEGFAGGVYPEDCKKFPKSSNAPADARRAVESGVHAGDVVVLRGTKKRVWREGLDQYEAYEEPVLIYSRKAKIESSECGEFGYVSCSAVFLNMPHYLERALAYRNAKNAARCKQLLKTAEETAADFLDNWQHSKDDNQFATYRPGFTYRTPHGRLLETESGAVMKKYAEKLENLSTGDFCEGKGSDTIAIGIDDISKGMKEPMPQPKN